MVAGTVCHALLCVMRWLAVVAVVVVVVAGAAFGRARPGWGGGPPGAGAAPPQRHRRRQSGVGLHAVRTCTYLQRPSIHIQ